jgi:hypothetical protein
MVVPSAYTIYYYRSGIHGRLALVLQLWRYSAMRHLDFVPKLNYNLDRGCVPI